MDRGSQLDEEDDRGSQLDEEDEEDDEEEEEEDDEEEEDEEEMRRRGEEQATDIKSNNPHLAGGEKTVSLETNSIAVLSCTVL